MSNKSALKALEARVNEINNLPGVASYTSTGLVLADNITEEQFLVVGKYLAALQEDLPRSLYEIRMQQIRGPLMDMRKPELEQFAGRKGTKQRLVAALMERYCGSTEEIYPSS